MPAPCTDPNTYHLPFTGHDFEDVAPARAKVNAAERSYAIELARFDAGTGSGLEVIQSQNMKARAKLTFVEQILRFNAAQIELAAAIGHLSPELFAP